MLGNSRFWPEDPLIFATLTLAGCIWVFHRVRDPVVLGILKSHLSRMYHTETKDFVVFNSGTPKFPSTSLVIFHNATTLCFFLKASPVTEDFCRKKPNKILDPASRLAFSRQHGGLPFITISKTFFNKWMSFGEVPPLHVSQNISNHVAQNHGNDHCLKNQCLKDLL